jgi:hypothetical protein
MQTVVFRDYTGKVLGTVWVENGKLVGTGEGVKMASAVVPAVRTYEGKNLTPKDPDFLDRLRYEFRSGYIGADWDNGTQGKVLA